ncbi:hypothetical protein ETB97_008519 [Aspergillus alliaceus]|uniref:Uncharacterized protein n=1 Tax=Petromyces alliaceus TaxID=209559 RepID=A0A8H6A7A4_PETAA|nr:hypothetical protein ETB97_008519 [Aspergillus burnettii]
MSNKIPQISQPEEILYCIWRPEVATEVTYCQMARCYPQIKYYVGRACAVAGYFNLYEELNLLSEVHIAHEARDNGHSDIYKDIMANPVKYEVAHLNGDTASRADLEINQKFRESGEPFNAKGAASKGHYFDIAALNGVDEFNTENLPSDKAAVT